MEDKYHSKNWVEFKQLPSEKDYYITYVKLNNGEYAKRTTFFNSDMPGKILNVEWETSSVSEFSKY
jgi:hypothetical protein